MFRVPVIPGVTLNLTLPIPVLPPLVLPPFPPILTFFTVPPCPLD
jgi:hypothetical protein